MQRMASWSRAAWGRSVSSRGARHAVLSALLALSLSAAAAQPGNPLGGTADSDGEQPPCLMSGRCIVAPGRLLTLPASATSYLDSCRLLQGHEECKGPWRKRNSSQSLFPLTGVALWCRGVPEQAAGCAGQPGRAGGLAGQRPLRGQLDGCCMLHRQWRHPRHLPVRCPCPCMCRSLAGLGLKGILPDSIIGLTTLQVLCAPSLV